MSLEERPSLAPTQPTEKPMSTPVSTTEEPSDLILPAEQPPTQDQKVEAFDFPVEVRLPTGRSITVTALNTDKIHNFKSKIEAVEPSYPSSHQRLVEPGCCDDIMDDDKLLLHLNYFNSDLFVLRGNLRSLGALASYE